MKGKLVFILLRVRTYIYIYIFNNVQFNFFLSYISCLGINIIYRNKKKFSSFERYKLIRTKLREI